MTRTSGEWAEAYRQKWRWDRVAWSSHNVDCYPSGCPLHAYVKDGRIAREEAAGSLPQVEPGIPDMNPMGCQKGACWPQLLDGPDRVTQPLRRVGERGEGRFEPVSWEVALSEIADAMLDAIEEQGPESIIVPMTPEMGAAPARIFANALGAVITDGSAEFHDFSPGFHLTWGVFNPVASMDDWFLAELTLIWHANPVYTYITMYHYLAESRYNGGEVVTIAPDFSPSAIHADYHQPIRIGTDAAFALSMCKVIIDAGLHRKRFVQEQTDLPLLVRCDTGRFLRGPDVSPGDRDDQFFWWDETTGTLVPAPRSTLATAGVEPALEGRFEVALGDGSRVDVEPVFARLRRELEDYTPEKAGAICEIHPDNIRTLARKVATRRTKIFKGCNSGKSYHGDLMERAMALLLALTGNWGRKGTGVRSWAVIGLDGQAFLAQKGTPGQEAAQRFIAGLTRMRRALGAGDPTMTTEMLQNRAAEMAGELGGMGRTLPPFYLWYHQYGYRERWGNRDNHDPSMPRSFDELLTESAEKGWWGGSLPEVFAKLEPRVLVEAGGNLLRRQRGGQTLLLEHVWPKLRMIVSIDSRLNTTGLYSDYVLPSAQHGEKVQQSMPSVHHLNCVLADRAVAPPGEALADFEIGVRLLEKLEERAAARGLTEFSDARGRVRSLRGLAAAVTLGGAMRDEEKRFDETIRDNAVYGLLPKGSSLDVLREKGAIRYSGWGIVGHGPSQASDLRPDEVHNPFRWHTEEKLPYDTLTRRAQFYIDHEWFLEAGEALPTHRESPGHGGPRRRFQVTSGHNRWSIHSMNMPNRTLLNTHRGEPFAFLNPRDAADLGIGDGDAIELSSDVGATRLCAKLSPACRPGQVILYNGFEPYMHPGWKGQSEIEPGQMKWLGMAGGYGHLKYRAFSWQPVPTDRAVRVDVRKV
ncbi:selenate/chlorate reductase subunit alpha [Myxococcaceae bacterium]|jgi:DMSO reductase family type II enzyme molybdopterin subunit|nr:selenate/chlorate reductase subunit alpha [Myxococcaceae bacterium]